MHNTSPNNDLQTFPNISLQCTNTCPGNDLKHFQMFHFNAQIPPLIMTSNISKHFTSMHNTSPSNDLQTLYFNAQYLP